LSHFPRKRGELMASVGWESHTADREPAFLSANQPNAIYAVRKGIVRNQSTRLANRLCYRPGNCSTISTSSGVGYFRHEAIAALPSNCEPAGSVSNLPHNHPTLAIDLIASTRGRRGTTGQRRLLLLKRGEPSKKQQLRTTSPPQRRFAAVEPGVKSSTTSRPPAVVASLHSPLKWPRESRRVLVVPVPGNEREGRTSEIHG